MTGMYDMEAELAAQPNDAYFKDVFSDPGMAMDFFQEHLPAPVTSCLDWASLQLVPGSFVKQSLHQAHSDLLFSVKADGTSCLLYLLFEHQSSVDEIMPFRLLGYILEILRNHAEIHGLPLPPVLPLVLHQGPDRWAVSPSFEDLFALPPSLAAVLTPYLPKFRHALLDLSEFDPQQGDEAKVKAVLMLMKMAREKRLLEFFAWLRDQAMLPKELLRKCLLYALHAEPILDVEEIARTLENNPTLKEEVMTTAAALIARGKAEGKAEGKAWGVVTGKLMFLQEMMQMPVVTEEELSGVAVDELERQFKELQCQYEAKFKHV